MNGGLSYRRSGIDPYQIYTQKFYKPLLQLSQLYSTTGSTFEIEGFPSRCANYNNLLYIFRRTQHSGAKLKLLTMDRGTVRNM